MQYESEIEIISGMSHNNKMPIEDIFTLNPDILNLRIKKWDISEFNKLTPFVKEHYWRSSSSIVVKTLMNLTNLWNSLGAKFARTSSTIVRHMQIECKGKLSIRYFIRDSQLCFLTNPIANIYSFASRTSCKLFLREVFSDFTQVFNDFFFSHSGKRGKSFRYTFTQLIPQSSGFCFFIFHIKSITMNQGVVNE